MNQFTAMLSTFAKGGDKIGDVRQAEQPAIVMGTASRYWRFVRIDATGRRIVEEINLLQGYFRQQFPELIEQEEVSDTEIQRQLMHVLHHGSQTPGSDAQSRLMAESCLRCFISNQIEEVCIQLETQFGEEHGFTRDELFPFVLNDVRLGSSKQGSYQSVATEILKSFDPKRSSLAAWTTRLVKHHQEVHSFLLERGVYLISDWAILNDTTPKQVQRIFSDFYNLTPVEIEQASVLLESYHFVYRQDRLKLRQAGSGGRCLPPTDTQLERIAHFFRAKTDRMLHREDIITRLQDLADNLRQYRIYVRGGAAKTESLDRPENRSIAERIRSPEPENIFDEGHRNEQAEFLALYRDAFLNCLDRAVEKVVSDRVTRLQRRRNQAAQQFISALHLFHCQERPMGEIASLIGFQAQYQVTRLLKLKEFRADIRQQMLKLLRDRILEQASAYVDPERLQTLDRQIEMALDEQIAKVIEAATDEANTARNRCFKSLFSQRLCGHLNKIGSWEIEKIKNH